MKISKKRLKKLQRRKQRKAFVPSDTVGETALDYLDDDYYGNEGEDDQLAEDGDAPFDEPMPTLEDLVAQDVESSKFIPIHRPRPTPKEWRREGEHTVVETPQDALSDITKGTYKIKKPSYSIRCQ